jgi:nucleotide-binding universal stress UspA family protein
MSHGRKVLIAVNGNKDVLVQGLKLIGSEKNMVTVVTINPLYEGDLSLVGVRDVDRVLNGISGNTRSEIETIAETSGVAVKVRIEVGDIDKKIVEVAEEEKSDIIIMGAGSQSSVKKFFLGNVLDDVTRQAPCPVLVVNSAKKASLPNFYRL